MRLTAADLILIGEALRIAETDLRYREGYDGPDYHRSIAMARLAERVTDHLAALPAGVTVD